MTSQVYNLHLSLAWVLLEALALAIRAHHHDVAVVVLVNCASSNHLVDQLLSGYCICKCCLHLLNLLFEDIVLLHLCFHLLLLEVSSHLLVGNLLVGSPSLATALEQVGRRALGRYS